MVFANAGQDTDDAIKQSGKFGLVQGGPYASQPSVVLVAIDLGHLDHRLLRCRVSRGVMTVSSRL